MKDALLLWKLKSLLNKRATVTIARRVYLVVLVSIKTRKKDMREGTYVYI